MIVTRKTSSLKPHPQQGNIYVSGGIKTCQIPRDRRMRNYSLSWISVWRTGTHAWCSILMDKRGEQLFYMIPNTSTYAYSVNDASLYSLYSENALLNIATIWIHYTAAVLLLSFNCAVVSSYRGLPATQPESAALRVPHKTTPAQSVCSPPDRLPKPVRNGGPGVGAGQRVMTR